MQTEVRLQSGVGTRYGLGVFVTSVGGRRRVAHGGAVSGYQTANEIYPDQRAAIVVLTNISPGAAGPESQIADRIAAVIFETTDADTTKALDQARRIFTDLQNGMLDRQLFSPNANAYFSEQAITDFASSLGVLAAPSEFAQVSQDLRGGMVFRAFRIRCGERTLRLTTRTLPDGRIEQYQVERAE